MLQALAELKESAALDLQAVFVLGACLEGDFVPMLVYLDRAVAEQRCAQLNARPTPATDSHGRPVRLFEVREAKMGA